MTNKVSLTLGYVGTDFTRNVNLNDVADADLTSVKTKILALNASLAGGTADGLDTFFLSDDYDSNENIGAFSGITAAKITSTEIENIELGNEEEGE